MLVDDLLGIGLYLGYFVVAGLPILLLKTRINLHSELTRKMPHFVLIFSIFPVLHFFSTWYMSILASVVLVLLVYPLLMLAERSTWYKNFAVERDGGEFKSSLIVVQLALAILAASEASFRFRAATSAASRGFKSERII